MSSTSSSSSSSSQVSTAPTTSTSLTQDPRDPNTLPPLQFPAPTDGLQVTNAHPRDSRIQFFEEGHIYDVDGRRDFVSCTTFVHHFFEEFDADAVVEKMITRDMGFRGEPMSPDYVMRTGKYKGMTAEDIKTAWANKGALASRDGTLMHACIEFFYNDWMDQFPYAPPPEFTDRFTVFQREVVESRGWVPYRTEWFVFDEDHELAGSIDMLYQVDPKDPDRLMIYDWKRSTKLSEKTNRYRTMHPPLDHLPDTNYWHYAMQLNIYRHILETKYGKTIEGMYLVGIHPELPEGMVYQEESVPFLRVETEGVFERRMEEVNESLKDV